MVRTLKYLKDYVSLITEKNKNDIPETYMRLALERIKNTFIRYVSSLEENTLDVIQAHITNAPKTSSDLEIAMENDSYMFKIVFSILLENVMDDMGEDKDFDFDMISKLYIRLKQYDMDGNLIVNYDKNISYDEIMKSGFFENLFIELQNEVDKLGNSTDDSDGLELNFSEDEEI